ncbi:hypothetical protein PTSG_04432 [Salpingoeca rosetta]|uniref:NOD3 protein n=1 Tax=Salpingoeca rosetta (strain ATCC 50818 / BSB-021) TaxID=946362 RepID=F2U8J6_SALR5|nr:uncharacterized protein PTSG_04432 [Salpingoeca rosetta]EGD72704.1 hypothetical protein PTSG_04432 [Salpingoeca rosetta]|eukprot:XP_004994527.1 hypothetical protein PTSG_04432 [Salpingoeca rosetta]
MTDFATRMTQAALDLNTQKLLLSVADNSCGTLVALSGKKLGDAGMAYVAEALQKNKVIDWLDLTNNAITSDGVKALADTLTAHETLCTLTLTDNDIDDEGARTLATVVGSNPNINTLSLHENEKITPVGIKAIQDAVADRPDFTLAIETGSP